MRQKEVNPDHNHHSACLKGYLKALDPHFRRGFRLAIEPTYRRLGRGPARYFPASDLQNQLTGSLRCHCLSLNQTHQFPHLIRHFRHFERLDPEILPRERKLSEYFPHFDCFWQRPCCFG